MKMIMYAASDNRQVLCEAVRCRNNTALVEELPRREIELLGEPSKDLLYKVGFILDESGYVVRSISDNRISLRKKYTAKKEPYQLIEAELKKTGNRCRVLRQYRVRLGHDDAISWQLVRELLRNKGIRYEKDTSSRRVGQKAIESLVEKDWARNPI